VPTRDERIGLIRALEEAREGTTVITYLTSTRGGLDTPMAMDAIPVIYEHLRALDTPKEDTRIDLFLHSNGGDGIVPWRLVPLIREHCAELNLLVPHRAFSAATLTAMGADSVLMHRMGSLGPTDPTVANEFNPKNPDTKQVIGISVEDVSSYINLVKEDVGIRHEDELVQAFALLARKIHPLALGNVKRATAQSRMMGEKLLRQREAQPALDDHEITELIEKLTSQLYFHGHPINRSEAQNELRLTFVTDAEDEVEDAMWALYEAYAEDMRLDEPWLPMQEAYAINPVGIPNAPTIVPTPQGLQQIPSTPTVANVNIPTVISACVESVARADVHEIDYEVTLRREWTGEVAANVFPYRLGWTAVATPQAAAPEQPQPEEAQPEPDAPAP
jgi:Serine dehydrogenase proteinase